MVALTFTEFQDLFRDVTLSVTGFDTRFVRFAYQGTGQPAWKIDQNLIFINVNYQDDAYDKQRQISYLGQNSESINSTESVFYTRVLKVDWSIYGMNAFDNADILRSGLLSESSINTFKASAVAPLTKIPTPRRVPYEFNNQWWERVDLTVYFNAGTLRTGQVPYLVGGSVSVNDKSGERRN